MTNSDAVPAQVARVPHLEIPDGWISVEDRLPDEQGYYLVYSWVGKYHVSHFSTANAYSDGKTPCFPQNATYWMPLPEPPKEKR